MGQTLLNRSTFAALFLGALLLILPVSMQAEEDDYGYRSIISGLWMDYHSGENTVSGSECGNSTQLGCIYGTGGSDIFDLDGAAMIVGNIIGDDYVDVVGIVSEGIIEDSGRPVGGYIDTGLGDDEHWIGMGAWVGYHSGEGDDDRAVGNCRATEKTPGCIYGGEGSDTVSVDGEVTFKSFIHMDDPHPYQTLIYGNVMMTEGGDYFQSNADPTGYVEMGEGDDTIVIAGGDWVGYHGGSGAPTAITQNQCVQAGEVVLPRLDRHTRLGPLHLHISDLEVSVPTTARCVYGGGGIDRLTITGGTLITVIGSDDYADPDRITYEGGTIKGVITTEVAVIDGVRVEATTITPSIHLGGGSDTLILNPHADGAGGTDDDAVDIGSYIDVGEGDDFTKIFSGCYAAYYEGDYDEAIGATGMVDCNQDGNLVERPILYGGGGFDEVILEDGVIIGSTHVPNEECINNRAIVLDGSCPIIALIGTEDVDRITYDGTRVYTHIDMLASADTLILTERARERLDGHVNLGAGDDTVIVRAGAWVGYHSGGGNNNLGACRASERTPGCIYGNNGAGDKITISPGVTFGSFVNVDVNAVITGDVVGTDASDYFQSNIVPLGYVDTGAEQDTIRLTAGAWVGYHSHLGSGDGNCDSDPKTPGCIYGGRGDDNLIISGDTTTFGSFIFEDAGGVISGNVIGTDDRNFFRLGPDDVPFGHVDTRGETDSIIITGGEWVGYHGGTGGDGGCSAAQDNTDNGCIYGGTGDDGFNLARNATVAGNVIGEGRGSRDTIIVTSEGNIGGTGRPVAGYITGSGGPDRIEIHRGEWVAYRGGSGAGEDCVIADGCIFGGGGHDEFILATGPTSHTSPTIINDIIGDAARDTVTILSIGDTGNGRPVGGTIDMGGAVDFLSLGGIAQWLSYHGGDGNGSCTTEGRSGCIYGGGEDDSFTLFGEATIAGNILGDGNKDTITISSRGNEVDGRPVGGRIEGNAGGDDITIRTGTWVGYHGGESGDNCPRDTDGCIYGNAGADTFTFAGGTIGFILGQNTVIGPDTVIVSGGRIEGNIQLANGDDKLTLSHQDIGGFIAGGGGNDEIIISDGVWKGYRGDEGVGICPAGTKDCIYGGEGVDTFTFAGDTIGEIHGDRHENDIVRYESGTITGDIVFLQQTGTDDTLILAAEEADIGGRILMQGGSDTVILEAGCYAGYDGDSHRVSSSGRENVNCGGAVAMENRPIIYGGSGVDTFIMDGGRVGYVQGENNRQDVFIYRGGTVAGEIDLGTGNNILRLEGEYDHSAADENIRGGIDVGGGNAGGRYEFEIYLVDGCYHSYDYFAAMIGMVDCGNGEVARPSITDSTVGSSRQGIFVMTGGIIREARLTGRLDFTFAGGRIQEHILSPPGAPNVIILQHDDIGGSVNAHHHDDIIIINAGEWEAYYGAGGQGDNDATGICATLMATRCVFGGGGTDRLVLDGGTIGPVIGFGHDDNGTARTDDDESGIDQIVLTSGTLEYVQTGGEDDIVRILGTFGVEATDPSDNPDIVFTGTCGRTAWICGGDGNDRIEYGYDLTSIIVSGRRARFEEHCYLKDYYSDTESFYGDVVCVDGSPRDIGAGITPPAITPPPQGSFAVEIEEVGVSPELGLWGGLSSALQGFGRDMMEDFTSSTSASLTRPFGFAQGDNKELSFRATPQAEPRNLVMGAQTHSNGALHARQTRLRGENTSHLTLRGVPGAVGSSSYQHDVTLTQHGFSTPVAQGLTAQGGFHLMQGTLTSSDSADQFTIEGYGAGTKLAYGGADVAMLGAWFDLESDDWGQPMAFSGTQWIISAGLEREITLGEFSIIPQARGFWQQTDIEDQGAISFSDDLIFTGKAGFVAQAGNHALDVFFTRDNEASSLDTGLVQNHRIEDAIEASWRSYMASNRFSLMGELRYRRRLETDTDSHSVGIAITRDF